MMTQENKDRLLEMIKMRLDGCTYQEIAERYGVTRQCVQQKLSVIAGNAKSRTKEIDEKIVFPNLAKWISENQVVKYKLSHMIGGSNNNTNTQIINKKLYGEREFSMSEIKKLLEITGQTFEYLFSTEKAD